VNVGWIRMSGLDEQERDTARRLLRQTREERSTFDKQMRLYETLLREKLAKSMMGYMTLFKDNKPNVGLIPPRNYGLGWIREQAIKKFKKAGLRVKVIRT